MVFPLSQPQLETEKCSLNHCTVCSPAARSAPVLPAGWGGSAGSFGVTFAVVSLGAQINWCRSSAVEGPPAQVQDCPGTPVMGAESQSHGREDLRCSSSVRIPLHTSHTTESFGFMGSQVYVCFLKERRKSLQYPPA